MNRWFGVVFMTELEQNCNRHAARLLIWTAVTIFRPPCGLGADGAYPGAHAPYGLRTTPR